MLMPLAVLLSMAFREFTGVQSYGVFTPTLFALVLTRAPWQGAATLLGLVLLFGVLGRWALPAELKRTPRLTLVITLVALGTVASVSIMDYFALNPDGQVMLLSIVILATMVDRTYRTLDGEGLDSVINQPGLDAAADGVPMPAGDAVRGTGAPAGGSSGNAAADAGGGAAGSQPQRLLPGRSSVLSLDALAEAT